MDTIFTAKKEELERLNPAEAVNFFRKLLWAEARRSGVPLSKIRVSHRINVPDGGIDASVDDCDGLLNDGLIRPGHTGYQIKVGDSFKPWQDSQIKKELFGDKEVSRENLGESVKDKLDRNGTYIIVCFGQDLVESNYQDAYKILRDYLKKCGYADPKVYVWSQNQLMGFLEPFPSLVLELKQCYDLRFQSHEEWLNNGDMKKEYIRSADYEEKAASIQQALRSNEEAKHIRIIAESGTGKTRFVLEVTELEDIAPLVIYTRADEFKGSSLLNQISRRDNSFNLILVVDECNQKDRIFLWNRLKNQGGRVKLITIYNQPESLEYDINYADIPNLTREDIQKIILSYAPDSNVERWAEFAGSSPGFAHMIGINLKRYPDDILRPVEGIYDRIVAGYDDPNSEEVKRKKRVLCYIALFKRFGYRMPVDREAKAIAKIIEKGYGDITWARFQEIIQELKSRKILQGVTSLYITPAALHIRMWAEWWDTYGNSFNLGEFLADIPEDSPLQAWFYEMFVYAAQSEGATLVVRKLLGEEGPFWDDNYLKTKLGAHFFFALTQADPTSALQYLKRTIARWSKEELFQFTTGRREVVGALERIAVWRELFPDAARLLLLLGEAENEKWANNASGVFANLFSFGYGSLAPTEASPLERLPVLREALNSESKERRAIAILACNEALESRDWMRFVGARYQGLRREPDLWKPKTYGELGDAYREVWQLLRERLDILPEDERTKVVDIFLERARGLGQIQYLTDMVIDTVSEVARKPYVDGGKVLQTINRIIRYASKEISPEIQQRWEQLKEQLIGNDFHSMMKRYICMLSLYTGEIDEDGNRVNQVQLKIKELAQECFLNQSLLEAEMNWLMTNQAKNAYLFGYELGQNDKEFTLLQKLIDTQRTVTFNANIDLLSGYFRVLFEENREAWENQLDALFEDENLEVWIAELTRRSGQSDRAALRILSLAKKGIVNVPQFGVMNGFVQKMSEDIFVQWINFLLNSSHEDSASIILSLYSSHYLHTDFNRQEIPYIMPENLTFRILTHYLDFHENTVSKDYGTDDYLWSKIGKYFLQLYPEQSLRLVDEMLKHFNNFSSIVRGSETQNILNYITQKYSQDVWQLVTKYLALPINPRAFHISQWLRSNDLFSASQGMLTVMPSEKIWEWVDEDVETRAPYLASFVPKTLFREEGQICLAREVLVRYGEREDVRNSLISNFSTDGWTGLASLYYQGSRERLLEFKQGENNENVKRWIDDYALILEQRIEQAQIDEERMGF